MDYGDCACGDPLVGPPPLYCDSPNCPYEAAIRQRAMATSKYKPVNERKLQREALAREALVSPFDMPEKPEKEEEDWYEKQMKDPNTKAWVEMYTGLGEVEKNLQSLSEEIFSIHMDKTLIWNRTRDILAKVKKLNP